MAETKTLNVRFQQKYDTAANWEASEIKLLAGEMAIESDTGKFKFGNGVDVFKDLSYAGIDQAQLDATNDSFTKLTPADDVTDSAALAGIVSPKKGDIAVIERVIGGIGTASSMTAYMYNGENWCALDGNYSAENVFFDENIIITRTVGNVETSNNTPKEIECQGKNIKQLFELLYSTEDLDISTDTPSVSFTLSANGSGEVGTNFTRPTATLKITDIGSYEYGSKDKDGTKYEAASTGITFNAMKVAGGVTTKDAVTSATSSMSEKTAKNYGVNETLTYTATESDIANTVLGDSKVTYDFAYVTDYTASARKPLTNLGNFKKSSTESTTNFNDGIGAISAKTLSDTKQWSAQGTRYWFYGYRLANALEGNDNSGPLADPSQITSDQVRNLPAEIKSGYKGGKVTSAPSTFKVPAGTKQVFFVFPKGKKNSLSIVNKSALSAPVACTKVAGGGTATAPTGVWVEGANGYAAAAYDLWYVNVDGQFGSDAELGLTWS